MKISDIPGCGPVIEKKLAAAGIINVQQLITLPPPKVAEKTGLDNESARELYFKARKYLEKKKVIPPRFQSGTDIALIKDIVISTGTKSLDKLLNGGLRLGACTEIYGEDGCGKTQFTHTMAVRAQLSNYKVIWIDTENTFKEQRIRDIAIPLGLDPEKCLENIIVARPHNSADQHVVLEEAEKLIAEDKEIKLIVIDSVMGLFRGDYTGREKLSERQKYLNNHLTLSHNISKHYNIATIWTNQVSINPGVFYGDPIIAIGGKIMGHKSTFRVYFKKSGKKRIGTLVKSPNDANIQVTFGVTGVGMVDPEVIDEIIKELKKSKAKEKKE